MQLARLGEGEPHFNQTVERTRPISPRCPWKQNVTLGQPGVDTLMQDMSIQDTTSAQDTLGQKSQPALLELGQSQKESEDVGFYLVVPLSVFLRKSLHFGPEFLRLRGGMRPSSNSLPTPTIFKTETLSSNQAGRTKSAGRFPKMPSTEKPQEEESPLPAVLLARAHLRWLCIAEIHADRWKVVIWENERLDTQTKKCLP